MLRHPKAFERIAFFYQFNYTCKIPSEQAEMKITEFDYLKSVKEIIKNSNSLHRLGDAAWKLEMIA